MRQSVKIIKQSLDQIVPDYVHVIANGRIVKSGGKSIAEGIELSGYKKFG